MSAQAICKAGPSATHYLRTRSGECGTLDVDRPRVEEVGKGVRNNLTSDHLTESKPTTVAPARTVDRDHVRSQDYDNPRVDMRKLRARCKLPRPSMDCVDHVWQAVSARDRCSSRSSSQAHSCLDTSHFSRSRHFYHGVVACGMYHLQVDPSMLWPLLAELADWA